MSRIFSKDSRESKKVPLWFHIVAITISTLVIGIVSRKAVFSPTPLDEVQHIRQLSPEKISTSASIPSVIRTGLFITDFREFDMVANKFSCEGTIWFEFDPSLVALDTISNFIITRADVKLVGDPRTRMLDDKLFVRYDVIITFSAALNYKLFPFDDHKITITLVNTKVSPSEIVFESSTAELVVGRSTHGYGWELYRQQVASGYVSAPLDTRDQRTTVEHPALEYELFYRRNGIRYVFILILPMYVLFIIMLSTFSYDSKKYFAAIMGANAASLSGLIGFRFVIESMSPKVGYFMISDYFFMVFLMLAATIFLISIFSNVISYGQKLALLVLVHFILISSFLAISWYVMSFQ